MHHKVSHGLNSLVARTIYRGDDRNQLELVVGSLNSHTFRCGASSTEHLQGLKQLRGHLEHNWLSGGHSDMAGVIITHGLVKKNGLGTLQLLVSQYKSGEVPPEVRKELTEVLKLVDQYMEVSEAFHAGIKHIKTWDDYIAGLRKAGREVQA